jgi:hypothetical protein
MSGARRVVSIANPHRIMGGAAKKVREVTGGAEGGAAHPVFVIAESDLKANGGRFTLEGGEPEPIVTVTSPRYLVNTAATPVYIVSGNP